MKVAVVDDAGFGLGGGRGVFGKEVYSELLARAYEMLGFEVYRVLLGEGASERGDVVRFKGTSKPVVRAVYDKPLEDKLTKFFRNEGVDLVHANILNPRYVNPLLSSVEEANAKLVTTVHSYNFICPTGWKVRMPEMKPCNIRTQAVKCLKCMRSLSTAFNKPLTKLVKGFFQQRQLEKLLRRSDLVISPSRLLAEKIAREIGVKPIHIPNPVNPQLLKVAPKPPEEGSALFIGRLEYEKGAHQLPEIARKMRPVKLYVAGEGSLANYLKSRKEENMVFLGYVSYEEKEELFNKVSVVVIPSIWLECYAIVAIEAFARARPIVAFDLGGPKELVEDSDGGLLAKPYDISDFAEKVRKLTLDINLAYDLGLEARAYVEKSLSLETFKVKLAERLVGLKLNI